MPDYISKEHMANMLAGDGELIAARTVSDASPRVHMSLPNGSFIYVEQLNGNYTRYFPSDDLPEELVMQIRLLGFKLGAEHAEK